MAKMYCNSCGIITYCTDTAGRVITPMRCSGLCNNSIHSQNNYNITQVANIPPSIDRVAQEPLFENPDIMFQLLNNQHSQMQRLQQMQQLQQLQRNYQIHAMQQEYLKQQYQTRSQQPQSLTEFEPKKLKVFNFNASENIISKMTEFFEKSKKNVVIINSCIDIISNNDSKISNLTYWLQNNHSPDVFIVNRSNYCDYYKEKSKVLDLFKLTNKSAGYIRVFKYNTQTDEIIETNY
jgi:hypothetical protein